MKNLRAELKACYPQALLESKEKDLAISTVLKILGSVKGFADNFKVAEASISSCFKKYLVKSTCYTAEKLIPQEFGKLIDVPLAQ